MKLISISKLIKCSASEDFKQTEKPLQNLTLLNRLLNIQPQRIARNEAWELKRKGE